MNNHDTQGKIVAHADLLAIVKTHRENGKRIVSTNGCYDILHPGHLDTFQWARRQGDVLIVALNSDASVRLNKGEKRPIVPEGDRAHLIAGLTAIDYVFLFDDKSPIEALAALAPDIHVKGAGSEGSVAFEEEKRRIEAWGGEVRLAPFIEGRSTTSIIDRIVEKYFA